MPRAIWRGSIAFGLVTIPVRMYPAISPKDVRFHEVDRKTGRRVRHRRVVEVEEPPPEEVFPVRADGEPERVTPVPPPKPEPEPAPRERAVAAADLVKGYEVGPDLMVHLDPEEVETLKPERTRTIEIEHFVDLAEIDPVYFEKSYRLEPAEELARRPYALLREAMEESERVAIGRFVLRTKEHLAAIRPTAGILGLETLYHADEVREIPAAWLPSEQGSLSRKEIELSIALIDALATDWDPARYEDRFRSRLLELIAEREPSEAPTQEAAEPAGSVSELMEALKASVEAVEAPRRAGGRGR
ncbi:MAG TPA: Ku protein [Actinomycetota bacterium]|nr:Ku protein [Actinomycetota bacterium]